MKGRTFFLVFLILLVPTLVFAGGTKESSSASASKSGWKKFSGTQITAIVPDFTYIEGLKKYLPEFEAKTGIKVQMNIFNETIALNKIRTALASGLGSTDVVWTHGNWVIPYAKNGWLYPLGKLISDPNVTFKNTFDEASYIPSLLEMMKYQGKLYALPFYAATIITYYRADIFKKLGIDPSELDTISGLYDVVKKLGQANIPGIHPIALRGGPANATWIWTVFLRGYGGSYVKNITQGDYYPTLDTPAAVKAAELWGNLNGKYGMPDAATNGLDQVVIAMQQGRAAIAIDGAPLAGRILDPTQSKVIGKLGFKLVPKGPAGRFPAFTSHGLGIAKSSSNVDASWYFLQWAMSYNTMKQVSLNSNNIAVTIKSLWNDPAFRKKWELKGQGDFLGAFQKSLALGNPNYRPRIDGWKEIDRMVGETLSGIIVNGSQTAPSAMKTLQQNTLKALKRLGYVK